MNAHLTPAQLRVSRGYPAGRKLRYLSVCSGIEAATVAWHPLGWKAAAFSEIEAFPRAVLAHHYPYTPCHGDFTTIGADEYGPIDLLVGGTPCQSFSIAGLRGGLADDRGNLALEFLRLAQRTRARWLVWENVPGVLSSDGGRDFGSILGGMAELGYGFAYRVLDAQFFGVPQRRRRVFVVGCLGDAARAAAVLFERHSLQGHPAPRREAGEGTPSYTPGSFGGYREGVGSLRAQGGDYGGGTETLIAHSLRGEGFDASEDGTGRGTPLVPVAIQERAVSENANAGPQGKGWQEDCAFTLETRNKVQAIAFSAKDYGADAMEDCSPTLRAGGHSKSHANAGVMPAVAFTTEQTPKFSEDAALTLTKQSPTGGGQPQCVMAASAVRRLTPVECERLQGFPDDYTAIPWRGKAAADCPDGPRYKALGNSMAVPVMRWIGERISLLEKQPARSRTRAPAGGQSCPEAGRNPSLPRHAEGSAGDGSGLLSSAVPGAFANLIPSHACEVSDA